jgi:signal transduction histidine kinase
MHFDDRLDTVLRIRADGEGMRRILFRQLLDLLGTLPAEARGEQIDAAFVRLADLASSIPAEHCAAILAEPGLRLRSPRLVAALAAAGHEVARAALVRAQLSDEQWLDVIPALAPAARGHLRGHPDLSPELRLQLGRLGVHDRGLPPASAAAQQEQPAVSPARPAPHAEPAAQTAQLHGISALVKRIEAYRKAREGQDQRRDRPAGDSPRLPLGEDSASTALRAVQAFDFATDPAGQIVWSDAGVAPMVTGLRLAARDGSSGFAASAAFADTLRQRQPLRDAAATITGAPAISGDWLVDAMPWFDPLTGRHMGWRGRMRRPALLAAAPAPAIRTIRDSEADRIRQLLHELRTPINAIQGFAEVIQQQLFGPTPHAYRSLAANIVGDAAHILSAFDELERLAKLDSAAMALEAGETDAAEVFTVTVAQLDAHLRAHGGGFALRSAETRLPVPLARLEVERIAWRLLATLAGVSAPQEILKVRLRAKDGKARIDIALPATLAARTEQELFTAAAGEIPQTIAAGAFGVGFALRLARAEAKAAGGRLDRKGGKLRLTLPGLPPSAERLAGGSSPQRAPQRDSEQA